MASASTLNECKMCEGPRGSHAGRPFVPPGGTCNDLFWDCPWCKQLWTQGNTHFHLWRPVTQEQANRIVEDMHSPCDY